MSIRIWKTSRTNPAYNRLVVDELLRWRMHAQIIQERFWRDCGNHLGECVVPIVAELASARVHNACAPILSTLERLEKLYAALGRQ